MGQAVRIGAPSTPLGDWRHRAACRDEDPELFFPVGDSGPALLQTEQAKAICRRCPVIDTCLRWAVTGQRDGVWGGFSEQERRGMGVPPPTAGESIRLPKPPKTPRHGTNWSWREHRCRCDLCVTAHRVTVEQQREYRRAQKARERERARRGVA